LQNSWRESFLFYGGQVIDVWLALLSGPFAAIPAKRILEGILSCQESFSTRDFVENENENAA